MALNVIRFEHGNRAQWGVVRQGRITPIPGEFASTADFIRGTSLATLVALDAPQWAESAVRLLSPITRDRQFVCQGANYRQHMIESGMDPDAKSFNMIFTKASSCIVAADSDVVRPSFVKFLDYEVELGLVLRTDIAASVRVTDATLHEVIAGIVIVNDYSARDVQIPQSQFYKGKSYRTFGPVGPYLCLLEPQDFSYLRKLQLTLRVNGEIRQNDDTANLVHRPAATLSELSGVQDLFAGDLIATGTPAGCALSIPPPSKQRIAALLSARKRWELFMKAQARRPQYLQPGDVVEARIRSADGAIDLGVQRNRVVSAAA
jgi:2-keto-4-pentenoate hydratase/2-oxohepta-3-ene-1,7-dioic acid hydratase in catechol pathway